MATRQTKPKNDGSRVGEKIDYLREATAALLSEIKSLNLSKPIEVENGIDFSEEVKRFEISLIEQALDQTGGNQLRAAGLLSIKHTTLHAKIKRYRLAPRGNQRTAAK